MSKIASLVVIACIFVSACTPAQDQNVINAVSTLKGDVSNVVQTVIARAKQDCPSAIAMMPTTEVFTQFVFIALGLPATGTVAVGLESSVAQVCAKAITNPVGVVTATPTTAPVATKTP